MFKSLLGTIAVIVFSTLFIEFINVQVTGSQIVSHTRLGIKKSAEYFTQETFKRDDFEFDNFGHDIYGQGTTGLELYIDADFYGRITGSTDPEPEEIYNELFTGSANFQNWLNTYGATWPRTIGELRDTSNYTIGEFYRDAMMTPSNLGVTYLDQDAVEHISQWVVASIFSDGNPDNINTTEGYVNFKGFRIYADQLRITDLDYDVININSESGRFEQLTNMQAGNLIDRAAGDPERLNIMLVHISYELPVGYEGITPIRNVLRYAWETRVEGIADSNETATDFDDGFDSIQILDGEPGGAGGQLPVPGRLTYYVVR